ncbi:MAG: molybdate ABC transporter substrate-binding protein [Tissierellia bacterium]|nr:molybdate ABC transporter substrate-binding protein [Tissierellia bacterium]
MKKYLLLSVLAFALVLGGCQQKNEAEKSNQESQDIENKEEKSDKETKGDLHTEITVSAAASLTDALGELKELYEKENQDVNIIYNFGASGTLQNQIEEGAEVDIFFSAAQKQMKALIESGFVDEKDSSNLLRNEVVLITTKKKNDLNIESFEDLTKDEVKMIALGEPGGVPVGQYSEEILNYFNIADDIKSKVSYGSDVRQVLTWVVSGQAEAGLVYKTDALIEQDNVNIIASAPVESHKPVIYPVAVLKESKHRQEAEKFIDFLNTDEVISIFEKYGFVKAD